MQLIALYGSNTQMRFKVRFGVVVRFKMQVGMRVRVRVWCACAWFKAVFNKFVAVL